MLEILKMRLPSCQEYDLLVKAVGDRNDIMHWKYMYSWCQDAAKETYIPSYFLILLFCQIETHPPE